MVAALLAGCGSGAVGSPPTPPVLQPISITPSTATMYSDTPTTFIITGGNGDYILTSSDQSALSVAGSFSGNQITLVPNQVAADTPVTLTVRDTGTSTPVTATLTVKPKTVSNVVTVTPSNADCTAAVCSGGDAQVSVRLTQNGLPLAGRTVRFEVISGNFSVITSPAGVPETTSLSGTTTTDASGVARMRIRVAVDAPSQTGLLQITDVGSGSTQRVSFLIAQNTGTSAGFFVTPSAVTFQGALQKQCANGIYADFYIFGGSPPYTISNTNPLSFQVNREFVSSAGGSFRVTANGQCVAAPGSPIVVRDAQGRTSTVTVANIEGTQALPALVAAPSTVTLSDCNSAAVVTVAGGTGRYSASSGSGSVQAFANGNTVTIQRVATSPATTSPVSVGISDGVTTTTITVNLTGLGAGACPSTGSPGTGTGSLVATPPSVTLSDCTTNQSFQVSGGSGAYTAISNGSSFTYARVLGANNTDTFFVRRASGGPPAASPQQSLVISDGNQQITVPVNYSGAGAGTCP